MCKRVGPRFICKATPSCASSGIAEASAANELSIGRAPYELLRVRDPGSRHLDHRATSSARRRSPRLMVRVTNLLDAKYATAGFSNYDIPNLGRSFSLVWSQRF